MPRIFHETCRSLCNNHGYLIYDDLLLLLLWGIRKRFTHENGCNNVKAKNERSYYVLGNVKSNIFFTCRKHVLTAANIFISFFCQILMLKCSNVTHYTYVSIRDLVRGGAAAPGVFEHLVNKELQFWKIEKFL